MSGFRKFLMRGNIIDLAVAVAIGAAFNAIIQALIKDLITPLITAIVGGHHDFGSLTFTINGSPFKYGDVINAAISFFVIATVVYWLIVAPAAKLTTLANRNKEATERQCPDCMSTIPVAAKRCMYCTALVTPVQPPADVPAPRRARHGYFAAE